MYQTKKITHSAIMIAMAIVLGMVKLFPMPYGGAVTLASMAPIIIISLMYDWKWGLLTSFTFSLAQILEDFAAPPVQDFASFALVILLDYVIAFSVLGLAGTIARRFTNRTTGAVTATALVILARFTCSFISGIVIWGVYAPEGMPVWFYSLAYNGFVCAGEIVTTGLAILAIVRFVPLDKLAARKLSVS